MRLVTVVATLALVLVAVAQQLPARTCGTGGLIQVSATLIDGQAVDPSDVMVLASGVVLVRTSSGTVWRSADTGLTWRAVPLSGAGAQQGIARVIASPADPSGTLYFVGNAAGAIWVTTNGGSTLVRTTPPAAVLGATLVPHPAQKNWLMVQVRDAGCSSTFGSCFPQIHASKDLGTSWTKVETHVLDAQWGLEGMATGGSVKDETIVLVKWDMDKKLTNVIITHDFGKSRIVAMSGGVGILLYKGTFFVAKFETNGMVRLYSSKDEGKTFYVAQFPYSSQLPESGYFILESKNGSAIIGVDHTQYGRQPAGTAAWCHDYIGSDSNTDFSISLKYNRRSNIYTSPFSVTDWEQVSGLDGIFIANSYIVPPNNSSMIPPPSNSPIQTQITFDGGATWQRIVAPLGSSCAPGQCWLNLAGYVDYYDSAGSGVSPVYSSADSLGMLLAVGNIGASLSTSAASLSTFASSDAGLTWFQIDAAPNTYEYGDAGALLALSRTHSPTNIAQISWDFGATFDSCQFSDQILNAVDNIRALPDGRSFLLHGESQNGTGSVLVHIDASGLFNGVECTDADYEEWSPGPSVGGVQSCLLGERTIYLRRKASARCHVPVGKSQIVSTVRCPCTRADYMCERCFSPSLTPSPSDPSPCVFDASQCDAPPSLRTVPEPCEGFYYETSGYRLVEGDVCDYNAPTSLQLLGERVKCPSTSPSNTAWIVTLILFIVVGAVMVSFALLVYFVRTNDAFSQYMEMHLPFLVKIIGRGSSNSTYHSYGNDDLLIDEEARELDDNTISKTLADEQEE